jgi:UDPglucose 6-dehydrogenase
MAALCIIGDWHQAVVLGACFAGLGHDVVGVAADEAAAARLNAADPPVHEPELPARMAAAIAAGRLRYTTSYDDALARADFAFIALDTPVAEDDAPVLEPVVQVARHATPALAPGAVVVVTAQVPVGTCARIARIVEEETGRQCDIAYVPEFLRLGQAVRTFLEADRFVIGSDDGAVGERVGALYAPLGRPIVHTDVRTAEMTKHACNAFLATSISFINEIADVCEAVGADVAAVADAMKLDHRIGAHAFLTAGLGFAGGTLGRDLRALQAIGEATETATRLVDAVVAVNDARADLVARQLGRVHGDVAGLTVGVLGLTYKAGTSTMRRSAALPIIRTLVAAGARVRAFDPLAVMDDVVDAPPFERAATPEAAAAAADALVLVTEWDGIDALDLAALGRTMRRRVLVDTRNHFDPERAAAAGFTYLGVGRRRGTAEHAATLLALEAAG